jgi:hypothetical protein
MTNDTITVGASTVAPAYFLAKAVAVSLGSAWGAAPCAIY